MITLDLVCAVACRDDGKPTQLSGCGVVLKIIDEHERVQTREFGWALGGSSANDSEIIATRLALSSVLPQFRGYTVNLHIASENITKILDTGFDPIDVNAIELRNITELKKWYSYYKDITVHVYNDNNPRRSVVSNLINKAQDRAKLALESQRHSDSGTIES